MQEQIYNIVAYCHLNLRIQNFQIERKGIEEKKMMYVLHQKQGYWF